MRKRKFDGRRTQMMTATLRAGKIFGFGFVCCLLTSAGLVIGSESHAAGDINKAAADINGPTVLLASSQDKPAKNPCTSFMYFVPLISPASVKREISADNNQLGETISFERKLGPKSFYVSYEFRMTGKGFQKCTLEPKGMIAKYSAELKKGEPLVGILHYVRFEGDGYGRMEVWGTIEGDKETVMEVKVHFNDRGGRSPLTAAVYSIKPVKGEYKFENRYDSMIARVNTLTFKRTDAVPRMEITVSSVNEEGQSESSWGDVVGLITNWVVKPMRVDKLGKDTMLDFGYAILKEKEGFTFPKAKNLMDVVVGAK